ncbi:MAG: hypothetical protein RL653_2070 [Pseudomonadota bacterium]
MVPQLVPSVSRVQVPVSVVVCGSVQPLAVQVKRVTVRVRVPASSQVLEKLQVLQAP